jgi:tetratricopeptide (TPR) repeat protein
MGASDLHDQVFALIYSHNKPEQAILQLNRILKQTPERSEALALKAYALNKLANLRHEWKYSSNALDCAHRALALNPNDDIALTSKGWALIDLGKPDDALAILVQATEANPENGYAWYNLAWAQYLTGNAAASKTSIMRALKIDPGNSIIKRGKKMMEEGKIPSHLKRRLSQAEHP